MVDEKQQKSVYKDRGTQDMLNAPIAKSEGLTKDEKDLLELIVQLVNSGEVDPMVPHTLINEAVYDALPEDSQGKVDIEAINLCAAIREIKGLYDTGHKDSYQMENLVERVLNTKERLEEDQGDLFKI